MGDEREFWRDLPRPLWILLVAGVALVGYELLGWILSLRSVTGLPVMQPSVAAATLLALGTAALAYSAAIQADASRALAGATKSQAESAERARQAALTPTLDIQIWEPAQASDSSEPLRPVMSTTFFTDVRGEPRLLRCLLRNLGPGNAIMVNVLGPVWYLPERGPWEKGMSVGEPAEPIAPQSFPVVEDRSLKANGEHWFDIPIASPHGKDGAAKGTYQVVNKAVLEATAKDVEGKDVRPYSLVVRLHQISPVGSVMVGNPLVDGLQVSAPCYQLLWTNVPVRGKR